MNGLLNQDDGEADCGAASAETRAASPGSSEFLPGGRGRVLDPPVLVTISESHSMTFSPEVGSSARIRELSKIHSV
jgi:hypothetical protein